VSGALAKALRRHWPEYLMEAAGLGLFMVSACCFTVLLQHPASPVHAALPSGAVRRAIVGVAMGLTAVAIVYSPWGKQSGAHLNPGVTLAFFRLGRVPREDAAFYVAAQFAGGATGVLVSWALLGPRLAHPAANFAVTMPGPAGLGVAFAAEAGISFVLMTLVLRVSESRHARWTGVVAGCLVALYISFEAPLSGMSMNPARTFASAIVAREWMALWIYFVAPPAAMLAAAAIHARRPRPGCAKLVHEGAKRCIFCDARAAKAEKVTHR
jgi:aquaporin Z